MTFKCIVIGLGQIGMGYDLELDAETVVYTHARALSMHPEFELVGAVEPQNFQREIFKRYYCQNVYPDITTALKHQEVSVVVIATPTADHILSIREVLANSRPKIILCEKPLAYDLTEAREIVNICKEAGVQLFVNYVRRADIGAIEIKNRIENGSILQPIKGVAWYSKGFLHNGSHLFDLLEFWLGAYLKARKINEGRSWNNSDPEPDVLVEFKRGEVVFMASREEFFSHYTIELLSPSGRLYYGSAGELITWQSVHQDPKIASYKTLDSNVEILKNDMNRYQLNVVEQLFNALVNRPHSLSTGMQALQILESMHEIINQRI